MQSEKILNQTSKIIQVLETYGHSSLDLKRAKKLVVICTNLSEGSAKVQAATGSLASANRALAILICDLVEKRETHFLNPLTLADALLDLVAQTDPMEKLVQVQ